MVSPGVRQGLLELGMCWADPGQAPEQARAGSSASMNQHSSINVNGATAICCRGGPDLCNIRAGQGKDSKRPKCVPGNVLSFACIAISFSKCQTALIRRASAYLRFTQRETEARSSKGDIEDSQIAFKPSQATGAGEDQAQ